MVERRNYISWNDSEYLKAYGCPKLSLGETLRHATYLINKAATRTLRLQIPYECFTGKKPNLEHLRVFGCIGYVKVDSVHLRNLDDRSKALVHLGTELGFKAYRIETVRLIIALAATHGWNYTILTFKLLSYMEN